MKFTATKKGQLSKKVKYLRFIFGDDIVFTASGSAWAFPLNEKGLMDGNREAMLFYNNNAFILSSGIVIIDKPGSLWSRYRVEEIIDLDFEVKESK